MTKILSDMSTSMKATILAVVAASVVGVTALVFSDYLLVIVVGLVLVGVALGIYAMVLRVINKKKSAGFKGEVSRGTAGSVRGVSDPRKIAQLDDLHRKFLDGVRVFESRGKDLYSMPWVLIVGEPGSGKTEAIRHCNVGFPPGMQDPQTGTGGTINMDWWFTNQAVLLDTAGRLLFEEVENTSLSEWDQFLRMLAKHRPNCPINGLLLVIPADSVIKDPPEEIERKAGRIAQQLDKIQGVLGVRFPVFVVITKCDLINGCREFFAGLDDPDRVHQMLGWSNPLGLDDPFDPELVDEHLNEVADRLRRRRLGLMLDPVHTINPDACRLEQVDDLYAFPDSLTRLASRLRQYMKMVFVAGPWSQKPLFLRGIYFTSSMQEGQALDAELAEALGTTVDSLAGGVWSTSRAYFLRDLFTNKVFKEQGLVTRATNTRQLQRRRKTMLMGVGIAATVVLMLLSWLGASSLEKSVRGPARFWAGVEKAAATPIIEEELGEWQYRATAPVYVGDEKQEIRLALADSVEQVDDPKQARRIEIPIVFRIWPTADLNDKRTEAFESWARRCLLEPVGKATTAIVLRDRKLKSESDSLWALHRDESVKALEQMIRVESWRMGAGADGDAPTTLDLSPLLRLVLDPAAYRNAYEVKDKETFNRIVHWLQTRREGRQRMAAAFAGGTDLPKAIDVGVDRFINHWTQEISATAKAGAGSPLLAKLKTLRETLAAHSKAEADLLAVYPSSPVTAMAGVNGYEGVTQRWREKFAVLQGTQAAPGTFAAVTNAVADVEKALNIQLSKDGQFATIREKVEKEILTASRDEYQRLLGATDPAATLAATTPEKVAQLMNVRKKLEAGRDKLQQQVARELDDLDRAIKSHQGELLAGRNAQSQFAIRFEMYKAANQAVPEASAPALKPTFTIDAVKQINDLLAVIRDGQRKLDDARGSLPAEPPAAPGTPPSVNAKAAIVCQAMTELAERGRRHEWSAAMIAVAPASADKWHAWTGEPAPQPGTPASITAGEKFPVIALTRQLAGPDAVTVTEAFTKQRMDRAIDVVTTLQRVISGGDDARQIKPLEDAILLNRFNEQARPPFEAYVDEHRAYWSKQVPEMAEYSGPREWSQVSEALKNPVTFASTVNPQLQALAVQRAAAMEILSKATVALGPQLQASVQSEVAKARAEQAKFDNDLNTQAGAFQDRWIRLANLSAKDPDIAVRKILEQTPRSFAAEYEWPRSNLPDRAVDYWRGFSLGMLDLLADEVTRGASEAEKRLLNPKDLGAFPIILDSQEVLDPAKLKQALSAARKLSLGSAKDGAKGSYQPGTFGAGETHFDKEVNARIAKLRDGGITRDEARVRLLQDIAAVLEALCDANGDPAPVIVSRPPQGDGYVWSDVYVGYAVDEKRTWTKIGSGNDSPWAARVRISDSTLELRYYNSAPDGNVPATSDVVGRDKFQGVRKLGDRWPVMTLLRDGLLAADGNTVKTDAKTGLITLDVAFRDSNGAELKTTQGAALRHRIGLTFPKPLDLKSWPRKDRLPPQ